ncbi:unnamed protein product [Diamesa serratosioi]
MEADFFEIPVEINTDFDRKIAQAFLIFDHNNLKMVDSRDVGTILRFIGCVPTEKDVAFIIDETEFPESRGNIHLSKFLPFVKELIFDHKMKPLPAEGLLAAFKILDHKNKGFITKEDFINLMTEDAAEMTPEEFDKMLSSAVDSTTNTVPYEVYINQLMYEPEDSIYKMADIIDRKLEKRVSKMKLAKINRMSRLSLRSSGLVTRHF